jgi:type II secretory pathway pseudopilin PulG
MCAPWRPRGFTFVELTIGILITSLVMGALAAVLSSVAQGWKQSGTTTSNANLIALANLRLQRTLKAARLIGAVRAGSIDNSSALSAAALLWKSDANYDWNIQFSEMALLEYRSPSETVDPDTIRLYQVSFPSDWTTAQKQAADSTFASNDEIYQDGEITTFKGLQYVTWSTLLRNVTGCAFHKNDSSATTRPSIDYEMILTNSSGTSETNLGSVALRTPSTLPVSQR